MGCGFNLQLIALAAPSVIRKELQKTDKWKYTA
jgi:hypothetical protein